MFGDAFAPPAFTIFGPLHWVPTIKLTVQVRARPSPGPLQARFYSRHLTRGVIEEDGEYWGSAGELVAISRQTAKLRLPWWRATPVASYPATQLPSYPAAGPPGRL